ncbi:MAG: penicillin acylase family protein, partial [Actinobacteria bacterium]|nr:penicillin acylase family protein [Actinomycetota bacterium]
MARGVLRMSALAVGLAAALGAATPGIAATKPHKRRLSVVVRRSAYGIPHIIGRSWEAIGLGYGYAFAQDDICPMAEDYVTVRAQRSRWFGPSGTYEQRGNGTTPNNLNSDFFYQRVIDKRIVEKLVAQKPPLGPESAVRQAVKGYVEGYNLYLRRTGVNRLPDATCRGKPWVTPIRQIDAYRRFYQLGILASQSVAIDGIAAAAPPTPPLPTDPVVPGRPSQAQLQQLGRRFQDTLGIGSNAVGVGRAATKNGHGLMLANPHFPWVGTERFYEAQATIPGKVNVFGASLFGVPAVLIGHTDGLAWSHTVSTAFRFTPFELKLVPGSPTTYLYDGVPH